MYTEKPPGRDVELRRWRLQRLLWFSFTSTNELEFVMFLDDLAKLLDTTWIVRKYCLFSESMCESDRLKAWFMMVSKAQMYEPYRGGLEPSPAQLSNTLLLFWQTGIQMYQIYHEFSLLKLMSLYLRTVWWRRTYPGNFLVWRWDSRCTTALKPQILSLCLKLNQADDFNFLPSAIQAYTNGYWCQHS